MAGFYPDRIRHEIVWNRVANLRGGLGNNLELDLINEFLNKEFKGTEVLIVFFVISTLMKYIFLISYNPKVLSVWYYREITKISRHIHRWTGCAVLTVGWPVWSKSQQTVLWCNWLWERSLCQELWECRQEWCCAFPRDIFPRQALELHSWKAAWWLCQHQTWMEVQKWCQICGKNGIAISVTRLLAYFCRVVWM